MAFGVGRALTTPLAVLNFILYLISACLAGWALNRYIDYGSSGVFGYSSGIGNGATGYFLLFALIASVVGLASVLAGAHHLTCGALIALQLLMPLQSSLGSSLFSPLDLHARKYTLVAIAARD
jgi:hypothetical protein